MAKKSSASTDNWVDPDDAPELTVEFFENGEIRDGGRVVRVGRPPIPYPKKLVSLRLDADVLDGLRALGPGWQTKANEALKGFLSSRVKS